MANWIWEYGSAGSGLHFTITYDSATGFTVESLEGKFDLNALWWDDGTNDGSAPKLKGADSSLNMNGSGADDWDGYAKLSNAGLGKAGENKASFISEGETATFALADFGITGDFDPESGGTLGVRATSVNGGDSFKLIDTDPEQPEEPPVADDFPLWPQNVSHVVLYFDQDAGDTKPNPGGDGFYTVKIDGTSGLAPNDLDAWIQDALDELIAADPNIDASSDLLGAVIKGGNVVGSTAFYAYGDHNLNGTAPDTIPAGAPQIDYPPPQGDVNGPEIDATYLYSVLFA